MAAATNTIRVGSGGVVLPNHAPLVVAEQFVTQESLYPGRIDFGLGRAPGDDFATMRALRRDLRQSGEDFPALLQELRIYLGPEQTGQVVKAIPGQGSNVPITLLGSSLLSAQWPLALDCRLHSLRTLLGVVGRLSARNGFYLEEADPWKRSMSQYFRDGKTTST